MSKVVPGLGAIPSSWSARRAKFIFRRIVRRPSPAAGVVTAFRDGQVTLRSNRREEGFTFAAKEIGYQGVRSGDLVIHAMDGFAGAIGVSESNGNCSPVCSVCVPLRDMLTDTAYYACVVRHMAVSGYVASLARGIRERSTDFRFGEFCEILLPVPPLETQSEIARFIADRSLAVDALIAKSERLIGLLQERRQALITQAVTRGLDPTVPMKDSGVEWVGDIPAHWTTSQPKHLCSLIVDGPHVKPDYADEGIPFVTVKNLTRGPGIDFTDLNYISRSLHAQLVRRGRPERGDILLSKDGATLGVPRVVETDMLFSIFVSVALLKPRRQLVDSYFLRYALEADPTWQQFKGGEAGSGIKHIVLGTIGNVRLGLPPLEEQRAIGARLALLNEHAYRTVALVRAKVNLLREYRQALISAAVTGNVDSSKEPS